MRKSRNRLGRPVIAALALLGALLVSSVVFAAEPPARVARAHHSQNKHRAHHSHPKKHRSHHSQKKKHRSRHAALGNPPISAVPAAPAINSIRPAYFSMPRALYPPQRPEDAIASGRCASASGMRIIGFAIDDHRFTPRWIARTLHGVIANHCHSKTYRDMIPLDGGTVGICHFASGSLRTLYRQMNAHAYFGEHAHQIPDRPYGLSWWRDGMRRFLYSPEAQDTQIRAWQAYITPSLRAALRHRWSTDRDLAIAAGVANSLGVGGFTGLATHARWNPERTLMLYSLLTSHKERRRLRLNYEFPPDDNGLVAFPSGTMPIPVPTGDVRLAPKTELTPTGPSLSNL